MASFHEHTIRSPFPLSHIQQACDGLFLALPYGRTSVGVWSLQDVACKPLELEGHRKPVSALALSHRPHPKLLCSAADDYVIVWNVERARAQLDTGQQIRGQIIGTTLGSIQYCSFSPNDLLVAVCVGRDVLVLDSRQEKLEANLEGHLATVNCAEFCPHYTSTLVTASDDRTFKIWDISSSTLMYQSTIISSYPFISLTMNPLHESFAVGTADGQVRVYDLTDGNGFRCLNQLDIAKLVNKVKESYRENQRQDLPDNRGPVTISSRPSWQRPDGHQMAAGDGEEEEESEAGCAILGMLYACPKSVSRPASAAKLTFLQQDNSLVKELLENPPLLVIGTTGAIVQFNARTLEPWSYISLQDPMVSNSIMEDALKVISIAGSFTLAQSLQDEEQVWSVVGSLFQNEVNVIRLQHPSQQDANQLKDRLSKSKLTTPISEGATSFPSPGEKGVGTGVGVDVEANVQMETEQTNVVLSVLSSTPLFDNSPLKSQVVLKTASPKKTAKGTPGSVKKGHIVDNQPLTFKDKVKSSGYSTAPRTGMFQPKTNVSGGRRSSLRRASFSGSPTSGSSKPVIKEYPMNADAPTTLQTKLDVAERPTAINCIRFSEDGHHLACGLGNTSAQVFKVPLSGKGPALTGHNGSVTHADWSHDNRWIVTSSDDKTASVWSLGIPDPLMTFKTVNNNFDAHKEGGQKPSKDNPCFTRSVRFAQFYYMDKFIVLTSGNSFYLYKYSLDTSKSDIKRYLSNNRYKLVKSWQMDQAQQITAFSAVNGFHSYLTMCAGSNKSIEIFDLNVSQSVRVMPDVHTRPVHCICQYKGSPYVTQPASAYDLFVTAAASDCIKLWDLRTNRCVRRYEGHANRVYPCGVAISPCSRYIATGSEDRSAYIFDIRSGTYLHKLLGHTDTVGDVAFHPLHPQLVTATMDGKLRLFQNQ